MTELITILIFCAELILCLSFGVALNIALVIGLLLFCGYALLRKFSVKAVLKMSLDGIIATKTVLILYVLIGILTAAWRCAGTVPVVVCYAVQFMRPGTFVVCTFLLCAVIALLSGHAFGAAATAGVVCMTTARAMGISPVLIGGAILSGIFFGDRNSPVSATALLISDITKTSIYRNVRNMFRSAAVPVLLSALFYLIFGLSSPVGATVPNLREVFAAEFNLTPLAAIPVVLTVVLSLFHIDAKIAIGINSLVSAVLALALQHIGFGELLRSLITGFTAANPDVAAMLNGGGIFSMASSFTTVVILACYTGIFQETGLLDGIKKPIEALSRKTTPIIATCLSSVVIAVVACSQVFTLMLTHQVCDGLEPDNEKFANTLADTALPIAVLVPWGIASSVPLAMVGAPTASLLYGTFLYLLPLWRCITSAFRKRRAAARG